MENFCLVIKTQFIVFYLINCLPICARKSFELGHHSALRMKKMCDKKLLDMCKMGNKIAPLQHKCQVKQGTSTEGLRFFASQARIQQLYY